MTGTARKSTHKKKSIGKKSKAISRSKANNDDDRVVIDIDPEKKYVIEQIGPVHLAWGKRKKVNDRGKLVKEYYIRKDAKHLMWVKWEEPFQDKYEAKDAHMTTWSAEPQSVLTADGTNEAAVAEALRKKVVWPWVTTKDEGYKERLAILKQGGYKEWRPTGKTGNTAWQVKFGIGEPTTETNDSTESSDESSSTDVGADEEDEEEDEV